MRIVEVGPRDGLQNEVKPVPSEQKIKFINALAASGVRDIEVTAFVSPKAVPQMANASQVTQGIDMVKGVRYYALVPNPRGLEDWLTAFARFEPEARGVALFTAASETFNDRNIHASIEESLRNFELIQATLERELGAKRPFVRSYVSTAFRCPYEGDISPHRVQAVAKALFDVGADEVSLGDTIGAATPLQVERLLDALVLAFGADRLAMHFHDTRGTALANVLTSLRYGVSTFDSSAGGLGGCPFAPGASGNLATEDLIYMLNGMDIRTGVDLKKVGEASKLIASSLEHKLPSKELQALSTAGF